MRRLQCRRRASGRSRLNPITETAGPRFNSLTEWLDWQQALHPRAIDLGLERVRAVAAELGLLEPGCPVITVAGTNGKGSCVAFLCAILQSAGYRVGSYTSPHLLRYNERVRIGGAEAGDEQLIAAFDRIDRARGERTLSYFEFGTLAAFDVFRHSGCDVWVLEVGLGGRLDAVNILDADCAIISSVGLDHTDWLGPDRESIGLEKAGVCRPGRPAIFGTPDVPASVLRYAREQAVPLQVAGRDYSFCSGESWSCAGATWRYEGLPAPALPGLQQYGNAASVIAALAALADRLPVTAQAVAEGLRTARLAGRFQVLPGPVEWVLDVAHNEDSVRWLARALAERPIVGRTVAVFAQMRRKELAPLVALIRDQIDRWQLLELPDADARPAGEVAAALAEMVGVERLLGQASTAELRAALAGQLEPGDRVVVFGSFRTVEEVLRGAPQVAPDNGIAGAAGGQGHG